MLTSYQDSTRYELYVGITFADGKLTFCSDEEGIGHVTVYGDLEADATAGGRWMLGTLYMGSQNGDEREELSGELAEKAKRMLLDCEAFHEWADDYWHGLRQSDRLDRAVRERMDGLHAAMMRVIAA
jgi:hypothetical protein